MPPTSTPNRNTNEPIHPEVGPTVASFASDISALRRHRSIKKTLLIALAIFLILCLSGGATVFILSHITKPITETRTPEQQAAELAKQANNAATDSANAGKTDDALTHYKEALAQYQKAGDKAGEAGVQLQIQYYEKVKANEEKAKAAQTPTAVTP